MYQQIVTVREAAAGRPVCRVATGLPWLDVMLGGGFVLGSVVMVHGGPGAGKSTALAQAAAAVQDSLYVTLEEDVSQVAARFVRLGLRDNAMLLAEPDLSVVFDLEAARRAPLLILDSLQLAEGRASDVVKDIVEFARGWFVSVAMVCHETKNGVHAGARLIEHMVDATLKFERGHTISTEKNRYGPAGIWLPLKMTDRGFISPGSISPR